MNILVTGAYGFIGRQIVSTLLQSGHKVIACVRDEATAQRLLPDVPLILCDFNQDTEASIWEPRLTNIDVVINCVGILQQRRGESIDAVHTQAPIALFKACENQSVKRVIQISAHGAEADAITAYGQTKHVADAYLEQSQLDWVVCKPSLVYGTGSYGGTSLLRGLCALPLILPMVGDGKQPMQPIHMDDVAAAVLNLVEHPAPLQCELDVVGPDVLTQESVLQQLRLWLGFGKAVSVYIPLWLIFIMTWFTDKLGRGPVTTTSIKMLMSTTVKDSSPFFSVINFTPRSFRQGLRQMPSYVQDRWHAKLYLLGPLLRLSLGLMWVLSGLIPLLWIPHDITLNLLTTVGLHGIFAKLTFYGTVSLDIMLGVATILNWQIRIIAVIQLLVIATYTVIISIFMPIFWLEPFGSIVKNIPIFFATMLMIALGDKR